MHKKTAFIDNLNLTAFKEKSIFMYHYLPSLDIKDIKKINLGRNRMGKNNVHILFSGLIS